MFTLAYVTLPLTVRLPVIVAEPLTASDDSVPTDVMFGWALVVTVPAVLAMLALPTDTFAGSVHSGKLPDDTVKMVPGFEMVIKPVAPGPFWKTMLYVRQTWMLYATVAADAVFACSAFATVPVTFAPATESAVPAVVAYVALATRAVIDVPLA